MHLLVCSLTNTLSAEARFVFILWLIIQQKPSPSFDSTVHFMYKFHILHEIHCIAFAMHRGKEKNGPTDTSFCVVCSFKVVGSKPLILIERGQMFSAVVIQ